MGLASGVWSVGLGRSVVCIMGLGLLSRRAGDVSGVGYTQL